MVLLCAWLYFIYWLVKEASQPLSILSSAKKRLYKVKMASQSSLVAKATGTRIDNL